MQMLYGSRCFGSQQSIGDDKKTHFSFKLEESMQLSDMK